MTSTLRFCVALVAFIALVMGETTWTNCANEGGTCNIHGNEVRTVRMGYESQWAFMSATNNNLPCAATIYGDASPNNHKKCYYANQEQQIPEKDWKYCCPGDANYNCKYNKGERPFSIRFGDNQSNTYIYSQAVYEFPCASAAFGVDPDYGVHKSCWVAEQPTQWTQNTKWISCAEENQECHLPIADAVYQVKMTADGYDDGQVKEFSAPSVACNVWDESKHTASFQDWFYGSKKQCWYSQYPTSEFHQNTGFWKQVEICPPGAGCSFQVDFGVSSTSSSSTSSEWSDSLTESFETNMVFEKETLTSSVSSSVTKTMSSAFGVSVSETCAVDCKTYDNAATYVYQWQATSNEMNYHATGGGNTMTAPFTTYACYWACQTEDKAPACPPNYCDYSKDLNCQVCTQNIYNTSATTAPVPEESPEPVAYYKKFIQSPKTQKP